MYRWLVTCEMTDSRAWHSISKVGKPEPRIGLHPPPPQGKNVTSQSQTHSPEAAPDPLPLAGSGHGVSLYPSVPLWQTEPLYISDIFASWDKG